MAYVEHGFVSGMKLTGADMAEVDAQIAENERQIESLWDRVGEVPEEWLQSIRLLSIESDTSNIRLNLRKGDRVETISVTPLLDMNSAVHCTSLTVSTELGTLRVGNSVQINATVAPSNSTDTIYYMSSNRDIASVSTDGIVKAVSRGEATITVACGSKSKELSVNVIGAVSLKGNVDEVTWLTANGYSGVSGATYDTTDGGTSLTLLGMIPYNFEKFVIHNGEKITINTYSGWKLRPGYILKAVTGQTPYVEDLRTDLDRYLIRQLEVVDGITSNTTSYTYVNNLGVDCYFVLTIQYVNATYEEAIEYIDSYVSVDIGPI